MDIEPSDSDRLANIDAALDEIVGLLHGSQAMFDELIKAVEDIEDATAELAWRSLPFWVRWHQLWLSRKKAVKLDMPLDGPRTNASGLDPHP